jgi:hypothetical protein
VALAILEALGALNAEQLAQMSAFGPQIELENYRKLKVGFSRPTFEMKMV